MMINFSSNRKNKGIGLLELMLSLAIIAILLIMATRYYLVTSRSQKTDEGVALVNALIAGAEDYRGDRSTFEGLTGISILVNQGSIAKSYVSGSVVTTPWSAPSTTDVAVAGDKTRVTISLKTIPATGCNALANKFSDIGGTCSVSGQATGSGTFTLTYPQKTTTP